MADGKTDSLQNESFGVGAVIDLATYKLFRYSHRSFNVFYLNSENQVLPHLTQFPFLDIKNIQTKWELFTQLQMKKPDFVFIEGGVDWDHPINLIHEIKRHSPAPVVLLCEKKRSQKALIKRACAAGVFDILFSPFIQKELLESLDILLRVSAP